MKNMFFVFLLAFFSNSYSQTLDFLPEGLGFELGLGYNQLKHKEIPVEPFFSSGSFSRKEFKPTPTFRLSLAKELISNLSIIPFVSYLITGGKSDKRENGYEDEYIFKTLDFGLYASYDFYDISFSIGCKYDRFLKVTGRFYGGGDDPPTASREWIEEDMSWLFREWSIDFGGRTSYAINHFIFALEGWFSATELTARNFEKYINANSKRFQLLIGYRL